MNELSLHILDICQNSIKANASIIKVSIIESIIDNTFQIIIEDDGHGMNEKTLNEVADPFFTTRTTRNIGMGVSLFKMAAEMAGGTFEITSEVNKGTQVHATFQYNHLDRAPLGNIAETICILILNESGVDIQYTHQFEKKEYILDTREIRQILDGIPFTNHDVITWIKNNIKEGILDIHKEETL